MQKQEDQETTLEKIRRKREERRRGELDEEEDRRKKIEAERATRTELDPAERRARARAEREKMMQGKSVWGVFLVNQVYHKHPRLKKNYKKIKIII